MTNYTGSAAGPVNNPIPLVDTTDLVIGGSSGAANAATKLLTDNDTYMYAKMGGYENLVVALVSSGASQTFTTSDLYRNILLLKQDTDNYLEAVLPLCSTYPVGGKLVVQRVKAASLKPVSVYCGSGDSYVDRNGLSPDVSSNIMYLHNNESMVLYNTGTYWQIHSFDGNYYQRGLMILDFLGVPSRPGTLIRDGSTYNRLDYPRLWNFASVNSLFVSEADWLSDPGGTGLYMYKSYFSTGNLTTTFRVPDDRGLFERAIGANHYDIDRTGLYQAETPGSRQLDALKSHTHIIPYVSSAGASQGFGTAGSLTPYNTGATGDVETRPINVGKWPVIYY